MVNYNRMHEKNNKTEEVTTQAVETEEATTQVTETEEPKVDTESTTPVTETEEPTVETEPEVDETTEVTEVAEESEESKEIMGTVSNCAKLNVRETPSESGNVLGIIDQGTEVMIDEDQSTDEFYSVTTEVGLEGFCMKKFITKIF